MLLNRVFLAFSSKLCTVTYSRVLAFWLFLVETVLVQMWNSRSNCQYYEPPLSLPRVPFETFLQQCRSEFGCSAIALQLDIHSSALCYHWLRTVRKIRSEEEFRKYMLIASSSRPPLLLYCKQAAPPSTASSSSSVASFATPPVSPEKKDTVATSSSSHSSRNSDVQELFHDGVLWRDKNKCLISGRSDGLEAAHVFPLKVGVIRLFQSL